jgi:beta-glucuronidase
MVKDDLVQNYQDLRLVSQSARANNPGAGDITQVPLDVAGWTMYYGIFYGSSYFTGTYNFIDTAKTNFPSKPIIDTEFGYWSNLDGSEEQKQVDVFNNTFLAFKQHAALTSAGTINLNGPLMACTWWCVFDWYRMSNTLQTMGLYTMNRDVAKPVAAALKAAYLPYYNFDGVLTDVNDKIKNLPADFELMQNYPNPFNPNTKIKFIIPKSSFVNLKVYDVLGNEIVTLIDEYKPDGKYEIEFNSNSNVYRNLSSGIYFYCLKAGNFISAKKMVLIK